MSVESKIQVAIVSDDIKVGGKIAKIFKLLNIIPHTFDDAKDFLNSSSRTKYNLCLLDIKKSKVAQKIVVENPSLIDSEFAFLFNAETQQLLGPTYSMDHLGYINTDYEMLGQVKFILNKFNTNLEKEEDTRQYKDYFLHHSPRSKDMAKNIESYREKLHYHELLNAFVANFEKKLMTSGFSDALASSLTDFDPVKSFALFRLNDNGTKLINLEVTSDKALDVPTLWLGKNNDSGIGEHTIAVVENIVSPLVKQTLLNISLSRNNETSDLLLCVEIDDQYAYSVDWSMLESIISGKYAQFLNRLNSVKSTQQERNLFSLLEDVQSNETSFNLVSIDLSDVSDLLSTDIKIQFDWERFFFDVKSYVKNYLSTKDLFIASTDNLLLTLDEESFSSSYEALLDYVKAFELSRYFTGINRSQLFGLEMRVKEVPVSTFALLNHVKKETLNAQNVEFANNRIGNIEL